MLLLLTELRTISPIAPDPMPTRLGTAAAVFTACTPNPLNAMLFIVESFSRITAAILRFPERRILQFSKERFDPTKLTLPYRGEGPKKAHTRLDHGGETHGLSVTFLKEMFPKFSAIPSMVGAVSVQSARVKLSIEFGLLWPLIPIRKAASQSLPLQLLTLTESMLNLFVL